jgi:rhodanese-related sulfurtransferase
MKKYLLLISLLFISKLLADTEMGCSISGLLKVQKNSVFENTKDSNCTNELESDKPKSTILRKTAISEKLMSVTVLHESEEVLIERKLLKNEQSCPPFCVEPMTIKDVITVGELETLAFIDKLKEKKSRLLIDVRESILYEQRTIPGALNLPFFMLKDKSVYQEEVLKLFGAVLSKKGFKEKWIFKNAQSLLIFGSSITSNEASNTIKQLLKLGYPSTKLLYYRAGIESWKALGLTTY